MVGLPYFVNKSSKVESKGKNVIGKVRPQKSTILDVLSTLPEKWVKKISSMFIIILYQKICVSFNYAKEVYNTKYLSICEMGACARSIRVNI